MFKEWKYLSEKEKNELYIEGCYMVGEALLIATTVCILGLYVVYIITRCL